MMLQIHYRLNPLEIGEGFELKVEEIEVKAPRGLNPLEIGEGFELEWVKASERVKSS